VQESGRRRLASGRSGAPAAPILWADAARDISNPPGQLTFREHASRIVDRLNPMLALEVEVPDTRLTPASPYSNCETSIEPRDFRAPPKRCPVPQNALFCVRK
jgi:hypothetical protein